MWRSTCHDSHNAHSIAGVASCDIRFLNTKPQLNMTSRFFSTLIVAMSLATAAYAQPNTTVNMQNQKDSVSYALGVLLQGNLASQGFEDLNFEVLAQAMAEAFAGTAQMQPAQANQLLTDMQEELNKQKFGKLIAEGAAFLAENATKEGVMTTESGLQYKVLTQGSGAKPSSANARVKVHYEGRLLNGSIFDSSYKRGEPITFGLNQVIRGWTEGVQLMEIGSKYEFYIPYDLAYGERGAGQNIPPYSTLIFVVELLDIEE